MKKETYDKAKEILLAIEILKQDLACWERDCFDLLLWVSQNTKDRINDMIMDDFKKQTEKLEKEFSEL
jgi:hypothetical protein